MQPEYNDQPLAAQAESAAETMKRVERELRSPAVPFETGAGVSKMPGQLPSQQATARMTAGPLSAMGVAAADPQTQALQALIAQGKLNVGPVEVGYQRAQPMAQGARPQQTVSVGGRPFDADTYFAAQASQGPGGRSYGATVGRDGLNAYGQYNPARKDVNVGMQFQRAFADGGPVMPSSDPMEGFSIEPEARPAMQPQSRVGTGIGGALSRMGQGISDYVTADPTPSPRELLEARMSEQARVAMDLSGLALPDRAVDVKADELGSYPVDAEGNRLKFLRRSLVLPMASGEGEKRLAMPMILDIAGNLMSGVAPAVKGSGVVLGSGPVRRGSESAAEVAEVAARQKADAASDAAKLAENAGEIERAAEITKKADRPHNPDTVGAEARDSQPITGGNEDLQFTRLEREVREKGSGRLTAEQKETVSRLAEGTDIPPAKVEEAVREKLRRYPTSQGWEPFEVVGFEKDPSGKIKINDNGMPELKLREQPYGFNQKKGEQGRVGDTDWDPKHIDKMADSLVKEVKDVANRSDKGDKNASVIMAARNWYATMRDRLRQEYGGFADVMADVLGTTSAQTGVRQNWDNTIEVLSQFSRGAYDRALTKLQDWLDAGGEMGSAGAKGGTGYINRHLDDVRAAMPDAIKQATDEGFKGAKPIEKRAKEIAFRKAQEGDFPLITKADGKTLFNANSPPTMMALLDKFRERKAGDAPKTPNFTGNLIGYSDKATIDIWAARLLRRLSGRGRLVPGTESTVSGGVLAGPLPSGIGVSGEFGFGQEVFQKAAKRLRDEDPRFANLGDDDLQAIAWFLEKETWGKKGYTTKAGEGGSMELEANFAGVSDRELLKETRRKAETDPTFTERNNLEKELADKKTIKAREAANDFYEENKWILDMTPAGRRNSLMGSQGLDKDAATKAATDLLGKVRQAGNLEKSFATKEGRLATLEERSKTGPEQARAELEEMQAIARRFVAGLSQERPDFKPTPESMQLGSKAVVSELYKDPEVLMYKATPSQGRYITPEGKIYDESSFDIEFVTKKNYNPNPTFRKMVEEAKLRDQESTFLSEVVEAGALPNANPGLEIFFTKKVGPDVVKRLTETINQLDVDAGFTFVTDFRAKNRAAGGENVGEYVGLRVQYIPEFGGGIEGIPAAQKKMLAAIQNISEFDGVSSARYVEYDTEVLFRDQYNGYLAGNLPDGPRAAWARQPRGEGDQAANRGEGVLKRAVGGAVLHRRAGGPADVEAPQEGVGINRATQAVLSEIKQKAEEGDLDQRKIAYLIRMSSTGTFEPESAYNFAGEILEGDLEAVRERFAKFPRTLRILSRLDRALGGEAGSQYGVAGNPTPSWRPIPLDRAGERFAKGGKVKARKPIRIGGQGAMEEFSAVAERAYGAEVAKNIVSRSHNDPTKMMYALNQYAKNLMLSDPPLYTDGYKEQLRELNAIAKKYKIELRRAFNKGDEVVNTKRELNETLKSKPARDNAAFSDAIKRLLYILR